MPVGFDSAFTGTTGTGNLTIPCTPVGTIRGVWVGINQTDQTGGQDQISGVTYGGVALVRKSFISKTTGEACSVYQYFLGASIPTGNQNCIITVSGANSKNAVVVLMTADGDTEVDNVGSMSSDSIQNPSFVIATTTGRNTFIAAVLMSAESSPVDIAPGGDYTQLNEIDFGTKVGSWIRRTNNAAGGNVTVNWTTTNLDDNVAAGAAIAEIVVATPFFTIVDAKRI